jgi:hypothetical protein
MERTGIFAGIACFFSLFYELKSGVLSPRFSTVKEYE